MAETLTTGLLWTLAVLGGWNAANLAARLYYREPTGRYAWSLIFGAWAAMILCLQ